MSRHVNYPPRSVVVLCLVTVVLALVLSFSTRTVSGRESDGKIIAKGAGTTIIHGGTGPSGGFVPVLTTVAFHAERTGGSVTGSFAETRIFSETPS